MAQRLAAPLAAVIHGLDPEGRIRAYRVWDFWDEVVGAGIAERARPLRLRDGVLVVQVSSATWMQELQFLKDDIRRKLNQRLEAGLIRDLQFVSGRISRPKPPPPPEPAPAPVAVPELPPTGSVELDQVLRRIAVAAARRRAAAKR